MKTLLLWLFRVFVVLFALGLVNSAPDKATGAVVGALLLLAIAVYCAGRAITEALDRLPR
jgi:hypothetical protein